MIDTIATVESNAEIARGFRRLVLRFSTMLEHRPGQFFMLKPSGLYEPLLRRAFAVYDHPAENTIAFLYQVIGCGTQSLSRLKPGSEVDCLGPLGNGWFDQELSGPAIVVSGGIGSASLLELCRELIRRKVPTTLLFGAADSNAAMGCGLKDFQALEIPIDITTDDGSVGEKGFVTAPLERILKSDRGISTVFTCGPWAMMKRVAELTTESENKCLVSLEAPMGCGFGVCVGCVVAVKTETGPGYDSYKRVCIDGSIFDADRIDWQVDAMAH